MQATAIRRGAVSETMADSDTTPVDATSTDATPIEAWWNAAGPAPTTDRTRPDWAELVEDVLAGLPAQLEGPLPDSTVAGAELAAFAAVLRPFALAAAARIPYADDVAALRAAFAAELADRLAVRAARTLVTALHRREWAGDTAEERFAAFVRQTGGRAGLTALLSEFPMLARDLGVACVQAAAAYSELVRRFDVDRAAVVATLLDGRDPGPVVAIRTGAGDPHQGGRSVAVLTFADGRRVVYKPRPVGALVHFADLLAWYAEHRPELALQVPATLARDGYGWVAYVAAADCADRAAVDRFYRRFGALLALLYAVHATDMHCENLVAAGEHPVLIDVETLFHPSMPPPASTGHDPATDALADSVLRTGLLPQLWFGENGSLDISAIGGDGDATFPTDVLAWVDAGTDRMRAVRRATRWPANPNRPRLGGLVVDPADYTAALRAGFRAGYGTLAERRAELLAADGPLAAFAADPVRVIARQTALYGVLLEESGHPSALTGAAAREEVFDFLVTDAGPDSFRLALVDAERHDLWHGDTPLFTAAAGGRDVVGGGRTCPDLLPGSGLEAAYRTVRGLSEVDGHDQEWFLTAALATRRPVTGHHSPTVAPAAPAGAVDPQALLAAARGVADDLVGRAHRDAARANWCGLEELEDGFWAVLPLGAGLAHGWPGVALFLAELGALTGVARYRELAAQALAPLPLLVAGLRADPEAAAAIGAGGLTGLAGIAYAAARVGTVLGTSDEQTLTGLLDLLGQQPVAAADRHTVGALRAVAAETGRPDAALLADRFAEAPAPPQIPAGEATDEAEPAQGWCCGAAGWLLATPGAAGDPTHLTSAADLDLLVTGSPLLDLSPCHGELGVLEALAEAAAHPSAGPGVSRALGRRTALVLDRLRQDPAHCGTPDGVPTPGLLRGLAGIGYGLLRLACPDHVPSLLRLDPTPAARRVVSSPAADDPNHDHPNHDHPNQAPTDEPGPRTGSADHHTARRTPGRNPR